MEDVYRLRVEVARLHERLDDNREFRLDGDGNTVRVEVEPGSIPDGIECRDARIALQDEANDQLRAEVAKLRGLLDRVALVGINMWVTSRLAEDPRATRRRGRVGRGAPQETETT